MANWDITELKCSNPEVVKACAAAIRRDDKNDGEGWKDGDIELYARTRGVPHEKDEAISKQFPNDVITCHYSFDCDLFLETHKVEYRNGDDKLVDIEPGYMSEPIPLNSEKDRDGIYEKAVAFCRRLDMTMTNEEGVLFLKRFGEEVCYKFEYTGVDCTKYRVEATKDGCQINFKVFEGIIKYDWKEIIAAKDDTDDTPF